MKTILVYDDEKDPLMQYEKRLKKVTTKYVKDKFRVETIDNGDFKKQFQEIRQRNLSFIQGKEWEEGSIDIDSADIFFVDYKLIESPAIGYVSGEDLAYLVRSFSSCKLIIGMNRYGMNTFDLTLKGHVDSYADLNIGSDHLGNTGLWSDQKNGFRPWHWPILPDYLNDFDKKIKDVSKALEKETTICEVLGFKKDSLFMLPNTALDFLAFDPSTLTFQKFVRESENGLKPKERRINREIPFNMLCRIAVARISKWIERLVLPGQDYLVDGPHLVFRFPSLLSGSPTLKNLNKITRLSPIDYEDLEIRSEDVSKYFYQNTHWVSRPTWFWKPLSNDENIIEIKSPWEKESLNYMFCEDASRFYRKNTCTDYRSDVDSPFNRRYIRRFKTIDYTPRNKLFV